MNNSPAGATECSPARQCRETVAMKKPVPVPSGTADRIGAMTDPHLPKAGRCGAPGERKRIEKLNYMHLNPVKRGLVTRPEEWPWSSFHHYATGCQGMVEIESQWTARRRERLGLAPKAARIETKTPEQNRPATPSLRSGFRQRARTPAERLNFDFAQGVGHPRE